MTDQPFHRLPDDVIVPLSEIRSVVRQLESLLTRDTDNVRDQVEAVISRIIRWVWPLLGELDDLAE